MTGILVSQPEEIERVLARCEGAFAAMTLKGYRADLKIFTRWCADRGQSAFPACSETIASFIIDETQRVHPSTLKRRLAAIRFVHVYGDLTDQTKASAVRLAMRRATHIKARRPRQADGLTIETLNAMVGACPDTLEGTRDAALISLGYDTLCRSCEITALQVEDFGFAGNASSVLIRRAKSDQVGDGRLAWMSPRTTELLRRWLDGADLEAGPIFRSLHRGEIGELPLAASSVRRLIKRAAQSAGLSERAISLSGHSMRVGGAQDILTAGFDTLAIMQAGGWKTPHVVLRYVEHANTEKLHQRRWARLDELTLA